MWRIPVAAAVLLLSLADAGVAMQFRQPRSSAQDQQPIEPVAPARLDRLERWLKAAARHTPGEDDEALREAGSWSNGELQALWIDVNTLAQLIRTPWLDRFTVRTEGRRELVRIGYNPLQFRRLRALRCAATGERSCLRPQGGPPQVDSDLLRLSASAKAAKERGDDNYVLRRGALLHTDLAILSPPSTPEPFSTSSSTGPQRVRVDISDGREVDYRQAGIHWEIARMVLDYVQPPGADKPAPGRDAMVRQWYRATAAWMQHRESHDTVHLTRAREIFPTDFDILFLSGCQREAYAGAAIQSVAKSAVLPAGFALAVGAERAELHDAETFFRRALESKPDVEARLRLGRVLARLGRHADAANELRRAVASTDEALLLYYGQLFLGAEDEALGKYDEAHGAYQHAVALYPTAQSPRLALSQLARRRGDRAAALRALQEVFNLPSAEPDRDDPWWTYHIAQARNADQLLDDLRRPFLEEIER